MQPPCFRLASQWPLLTSRSGPASNGVAVLVNPSLCYSTSSSRPTSRISSIARLSSRIPCQITYNQHVHRLGSTPSIRRHFTNTSSCHASSSPKIELDDDVVVQVVRLRIQKRQRLLNEITNSTGDPTISSSKEDLKLLDYGPLENVWDQFEARRKQLISTIQMSESQEEDQTLREMALEEIPLLDQQVFQIRNQMRNILLKQVADSIDENATGAIMELRPGVGGQESSLFVGQVTRMYTKFCENKPLDDDGNGEWKVELLSCINADVSASGPGTAGYKEAILEIKGKGAFQRLKYEAGVHRVQRIPTTQNLGKLQSSTIAMVVLPVLNSNNETSKADDIVDPKDVKLEVMRSRGAGGQHVNKTESAVRLTHEPTGITVSMQDSRSQQQNRTKAWAVLRARLLDRKMRQDIEGNRAMRLSQISGMDRTDRVRTYNFPQDRVSDHRINLSVSGIDSIMEGEYEEGLGLEYMISQLEQASQEQKLASMLEVALAEQAPYNKADQDGASNQSGKSKRKVK